MTPRLFAWASEHHLDTAALAHRCGMPELGPEDEPLVPLAALKCMSAAVAKELKDPLLGLHLAQVLAPPDYGAIGFLARAAGTLGEALELFAAHSRSLNSTWSVTLEQTQRGSCLRQRIPHEPDGLGPVGNLYLMCGLVVLARRLQSACVSPVRVWVAHHGRSNPELSRFLGCPLEFGRGENGMEVDADVLRLPLPSVDPALASWLERSVLGPSSPAARTDPLAELRRLIRESLPASITLVSAARALALSSRSLQRRLADEHTTYNDEVNRVRRELASELLAEDLPLGEISYRCGFSDTRAFTRAFKRWTGLTPGAAKAGAVEARR